MFLFFAREGGEGGRVGNVMEVGQDGAGKAAIPCSLAAGRRRKFLLTSETKACKGGGSKHGPSRWHARHEFLCLHMLRCRVGLSLVSCSCSLDVCAR